VAFKQRCTLDVAQTAVKRAFLAKERILEKRFSEEEGFSEEEDANGAS
jgi:hypothetical protein